MSNDNRKSPFSGTTEGDEEDWEKALNAWEIPDAAAPEDKPEPAAAPQAAPTVPPKAPLYHPPSPTAPTPIPPRLDDDAQAAFESYDDDDADEATIVSRVSAELLAGAGAPPRAGGQGSGLGQVFRREMPKPPADPSSGRGDALLDMLFEDPADLAAVPADESVVTSAPHVHVEDRARIPDEERKRSGDDPVDDVPEGSLFDPFAPARDERAPTMRPGAAAPTPAAVLPPAPPPAPLPRFAPTAPRPMAAPRPGGTTSRLPLVSPPAPPRPPAAPPIPPAPAPDSSAITSRPILPISAIDEEEDTQIRLDSVPPDSLPPPGMDLPQIMGQPVLDLGPSTPLPDAYTLQGGHALPAVAARSPSYTPPVRGHVPSQPPLHSPVRSQPPSRDPLETLVDESSPSLLNDPDELDAWRIRTAWMEQEARASVDRVVKARGLLVVSELYALAGDELRAHELAVEARDLAPTHPLPHRQARALSVGEGDWNAVTLALQGEARAASTPAARVHGALLGAEIARVVQGDKDLANKRLEQAIRAAPPDPRGYLTRLATALGESETLPKIRWPEGPELAPLAEASQTLSRWHGAGERGLVFANPVDALMRARASVRARDPLGTIQALEALGETAGLTEAAGWLAAATALAYPSAEAAIPQRLDRLAHGTLPRVARRATTAHALEKGETVTVMSSLNDTPDDTFSMRDRAVIGALAGADAPALEKWLEPLDRDPEWGMLASAIRSALGSARSTSDEPSEAHVGTRLTNPAIRLARLLGAGASSDDLQRAIRALEETTPGLAISQVLATEIDMETGRVDRLADTLSKQGGESGNDARDRALMAGLLYEVAEQTLRARELYTLARTADPSCEAAVRAELFVSPPSETANLLSLHEASLDDARSSALIVLEAAHNTGEDPESYSRLLKEAHAKAPSLPFAAWLAERRARARGEFDNIVEWLRERRRSSDDAVEQAYDLVREALLIADRDLDEARDLLEQASRSRPADLALRELYERLSSEPPPDKAAFWAERALVAQGTDRARIGLLAAMEQERAGNFEQAARLAQASLEVEDTPLTRLCAERNEVKGGFAANLAERLIEQARTTADPQARIETYERLADIDEASRGDAASAVLWHQSILEERPGYLPSLSRLEHWLIGDGRENELEPIAGEIARALIGTEAMAHAHVAARLRTRSGPWQAGIEFVRIAFDQEEPPLWSLREMEAHAALASDAPVELLAARRLLEHTTRPLEIATLALRGADAAMRAGDPGAAKDLLVRATNAHPTHLVVQRTLAELCEQTSDFAGAAEAWEAIATLSGVAEHQLDANHRAAVIWLDRLKDAERGRAALEAAAQIDVTHHDVFTRLQGLYVATGEREALASLLETRLASVRDPNERIELEIIRGRTLAEIGDAPAAKRALAYALEESPDHPDALRAFADICAREADWTSVEQALIRLVRLLPDSAEQAAIYMRLGELYDEAEPNPERAELAYREVLRRMPTDVTAQERLVDVYRRVGNGPRAIEVQQALLAAADSPEVKRKRTIELANVYDQVAHDPKKGEALLEAARKEFPSDVDLLAAVVAFYQRSNRLPAVQVLLDRAAGDARRALSTGRFDVSLFSMLGAVARLRDRRGAASIAEATVAAIEGRPSELFGAGSRAADPRLDDQLAPELLTSAFRALLRKSGEILDAAVPVDLKGLRAVLLAQQTTAGANEIRELGAAFGLHGLEVFVSQQLGSVCLPIGSHPPQIVIGQPLLGSTEDDVRRFLVTRALKIVQARASALARSAPIDLLPLVSGYLMLFAPDWQPAAVDAGKLRDMHARLGKAKPARLDDDVGVLALEVIGSLGNRASTLHTVVNGWGNRVALLAAGNLSTALSSIARAAGHSTGPAQSGPERATWIGRNAEARDLAVFSVSDAYAEVRNKLGV